MVDDALGDQTLSFAELSRRSSQVANFLAAEAIGRGDRILIMLGNVVSLWETMLAAMKLGAVIIPATTLLERDELKDRLGRGKVKAIITHSGLTSRLNGLLGAQVRLAVGESVPGWLDLSCRGRLLRITRRASLPALVTYCSFTSLPALTC